MTQSALPVLNLLNEASFFVTNFNWEKLRVFSQEPGWPGLPGYWDQFRLGLVWEISPRFLRFKKARRSWDRVLAPLSTMWRMRCCEELIPPSFPVTGLNCSYGKIFSPLNEVLVGNPRSREPSQPALSYEPIKNFTKALEQERIKGTEKASPIHTLFHR